MHFLLVSFEIIFFSSINIKFFILKNQKYLLKSYIVDFFAFSVLFLLKYLNSLSLSQYQIKNIILSFFFIRLKSSYLENANFFTIIENIHYLMLKTSYF